MMRMEGGCGGVENSGDVQSHLCSAGMNRDSFCTAFLPRHTNTTATHCALTPCDSNDLLARSTLDVQTKVLECDFSVQTYQE
jgi:hypothetical protein